MPSTRPVEYDAIDWAEPVSIAGHRTSVYVVEGDGMLTLEPRCIRVKHGDCFVDLPPQVAVARDLAKSRIAASGSAAGYPFVPWNSDSMVALCGYRISRLPDSEEVCLRLDTCRNDYATFTATVLGLDLAVASTSDGGTRETLRQEFLDNPIDVISRLRTPEPALANGLGVTLLAFTNDNNVIVTRRRASSMTRPGERDVSVVEGLHATHDRRAAGRLSVYGAAVRGCFEELGVEVSEADVHLLAFGVDMRYYQWNFYGYVDLNRTSQEVLDSHSKHARDRWEGRLECVPADPAPVLDRLRLGGTWDTAVVTAYYAFCKKRSVDAARRAAEEVFGTAKGTLPRRGRSSGHRPGSRPGPTATSTR